MMLLVRLQKSKISVCFDISIPYLAHWYIIMRECVTFIYDANTFVFEVKFIEFLTWLCVWATAFLPFVIVIPILAYECITMEQCVTYTLDLCMTLTCGLYIKNIFSPWFFVWARLSLLFDIGIPNLALGCITMRQHVVYIHDLKWSWPLTYMWLAGGYHKWVLLTFLSWHVWFH